MREILCKGFLIPNKLFQQSFQIHIIFMNQYNIDATFLVDIGNFFFDISLFNVSCIFSRPKIVVICYS